MISYIVIAFVVSLQCENILTIKNGQQLNLKDARFMVAIFIQNPSFQRDKFRCVGVEVHRRYILTTKECTIHNIETEKLTIRYGSLARDRGFIIGILGIFTNEDFPQESERIALLELDGSLSDPRYGFGVAPITLPGVDSPLQAGMSITVIGYEQRRRNDHYKLSKVTTSVNEILVDGNVFTAISTSQGVHLITYGDEGSPVFLDNIFVGVVAHLDPTEEFVIITQISSNKNFIERVINGRIEVDKYNEKS